MLSSHYHLWDLANAFASCSVEEQMHLLPCLNSEACPKNKELKNLLDYFRQLPNVHCFDVDAFWFYRI